jgi:hypothetical protein
MDNKKEADRVHQTLPQVKQERRGNKLDKIKEMSVKNAKDQAKGMTYGTGIALVENLPVLATPQPSRSRGTKRICPFCEKKGHVT